MGNGTSPVATKQCEVRWSHAALCSDVGQQWGHLVGAAHLGDVLQKRKQQPTKNQQYKLSFTVHIICTETFLVGFAAWVCQMLHGCVLAQGDIEPGEMVPAALHTHCLLAECSAEPQKGPYLWFHATALLTLPLHYFEVTFWAWSHLLEDVGLYCLYHWVLWVVVLGLKHSDAVLPWLLPGLPVGFPAGRVVLWVALQHSPTGWSWGNESLDHVRADFVHYAAWMDGGYAIKQRDLTNLMKRAFRIYLRDWIYHKVLILPSVQMQLEAVFNGMSLLSWGAPYLGRL